MSIGCSSKGHHSRVRCMWIIFSVMVKFWFALGAPICACRQVFFSFGVGGGMRAYQHHMLTPLNICISCRFPSRIKLEYVWPRLHRPCLAHQQPTNLMFIAHLIFPRNGLEASTHLYWYKKRYTILFLEVLWNTFPQSALTVRTNFCSRSDIA